MANDEKKWLMEIGAHGGTVQSRDSEVPEKFDSEGDAMAHLREREAYYDSIGYKIWYAYLTPPGGEKRTLRSDNSYHG